MYTLGLYEKAMPDDVPLEQKLAAARKAGYDFLELSIDESDARLARLEWTASQREAMCRAMAKAGLQMDTMCLSAHRKYPLGSIDDKTAARSLVILEQAVILAKELGIRLIQLAGYDVYYEPSTAQTRSRFSDNLKKGVEIAAAAGVVLGFETMETPFMNTVSKAMWYVEEVCSPYLQVYPDVGNLTNGCEDVKADIAAGSGHIVAAHLKETQPGKFRDLRYGEGHVDFPGVIAALWRQGVRKYNAEFWYRPGEDWETAIRTANRQLRCWLDRGGM